MNLTSTLQKIRPASLKRGAKSTSRRRRMGRRLFLEALEDRSLMALISHWTGNNTAADAIGTNSGTLISGTTYAAGQVGQAFSFDGVDDRIGLADSASLKLTGSMTIEGWVKATGLPAQHGMIFFRGDDRGGLDPYWMSVESNGLLVFNVESGTASAGVSTQMPLGQFVHVAATLDDATGEINLYLNSVLMSHTVTSVRPFKDLDSGSNPGIGIGNHGGYPSTPHNFPFKGLIDELRVYDHALTAADVLTHYNAEQGSTQPTISVSNTTADESSATVQYQGNLVSPGEGGMDNPYAMIYGPDGNLYVSTLSGSSVLRYDAATGAPLPAPGKSGAEFVSPGAGGLDTARGLAFGPDGNLYVVSVLTSAVLRFDGATGEPLGDFVPSGSGGLNHPRGLLFHSDGYLYVTSTDGDTGSAIDAVLRFDAVTGAPAEIFITSGSGGLDNPSEIVFHNGIFYVASTNPSTSNSVLRYGVDGSFQGAFVSTGYGGLAGPSSIAFQGNYLYVSSWTNNKVLRFDGTTGAYVDDVANGGGLLRPMGLLFEADGTMLVASGDSDEIRQYGMGSSAIFTISLSAPMPGSATVNYATGDGTALADSDYLSRTGTVQFSPGQWTKTVVIPIVNDLNGEPTETFVLNLSAASGAAISDDQGIATIIDDDPGPTKFYVVNDGSPDRTFEYGSKGKSLEDYSINSGNTAPRGAVSTAAADKVWVVDANKKVYVYNTSGGLLGSWTVGGITGSPQLEGIATNGTDVWLVDAKADKVYRYANAASRTSGTQNAASSFNLFSKGPGPYGGDYSNSNPKDMVTDGNFLWVLNDGVNEDKLFKYTLTGTAVWNNGYTIDAANAQPTGITLDPSSPSDFWIVDAGTDRVYRYAGAVFQAGGGLAHSFTDSFALAAGNTNPQGIADPPVGGARAFEPAAAAPSLAGVLAAAGTAQTPVATSESTTPTAPPLLSAPAANGTGLIAEGSRFMALGSDLAVRARAAASHDEAICGLADELDSLLPARKLRR